MTLFYRCSMSHNNYTSKLSKHRKMIFCPYSLFEAINLTVYGLQQQHQPRTQTLDTRMQQHMEHRHVRLAYLFLHIKHARYDHNWVSQFRHKRSQFNFITKNFRQLWCLKIMYIVLYYSNGTNSTPFNNFQIMLYCFFCK
jgi:hypothetical protein